MKAPQIIGYILITPALLGVVAFLLHFLCMDLNLFTGFWDFGRGSGRALWIIAVKGEGTATPALPIYLGLQAIAGAYLIKTPLTTSKNYLEE